ncbi:MAG: multidrug efflux SMR transporter [Proteobacteria bacterium]|nr:multidrug efflux SMR transporter [Pseudomonadota bacterium]
MAWLLLTAAGVFEIAWAVALKLSDGFSRPLPSVIVAVSYAASIALLSWSMRSLPLGTAYTVWTGIGAIGTFLIGLIFLGEPARPDRIFAAALIIAGIALMKLSSQ